MIDTLKGWSKEIASKRWVYLTSNVSLSSALDGSSNATILTKNITIFYFPSKKKV